MGRKKRKSRPELLFSGAPTLDLDALDCALARAVRAEVGVGGSFVSAVDPDEDVLADGTLKRVVAVRSGPAVGTTGMADLAALVTALTVNEVTDFVCMCTGDLVIEFFDSEGMLIEVVRIDLPDSIECHHWLGKATLAEPDRLTAWLRAHHLPADSDELHAPLAVAESQ
ncbi:hypothetical protein [Myceligenerans salitolerans]|uniref:Uncharacterized protein n=1 Tax=Myceligenerans salitolerans TaxID=1230528 RepID=A0ABS3I3T0_9MICO|nr:hypothetical protein [Myceligenerans salitolerans]MBO0607645.1 hypothetical protein [Myceligenerans salitolerans]